MLLLHHCFIESHPFMYILPHVEQVPWVGLPPIQHQPYRANGFWHNASG
jgi:hypothetical protein